MTTADYQRNAIDNRSAWAKAQGELFREMVDKLAASAIADFDHQSGPRGVSTEGSLREVGDNTKGFCRDLEEAVSRKVADYVFEKCYAKR